MTYKLPNEVDPAAPASSAYPFKSTLDSGEHVPHVIVQSDADAVGAGTAAAAQRSTLASDDPAVVALQIMDDWDESDRAKVNPIVGQAGVAAGAGAVNALTQRTTLASDDPAVAVLGATSGAAVITDDTGTIQQYLRGIVKLLVTAGTVVLGAGSALIGKVGFDQTTPGTTNAVAPIAGQNGVAAGAGAVGATVQRTTLASDDPAVVSLARLAKQVAGQYETVAASQTGQALGATGAAGDYIKGLLVIPANLNPGQVLLIDNATSITIFAGGAASLTELKPFFVPLDMISASGAWKITTGADVSVIAVGQFT